VVIGRFLSSKVLFVAGAVPVTTIRFFRTYTPPRDFKPRLHRFHVTT
jgi:hypothetical protein